MPAKVLLMIDCQRGFITTDTAHLPARWEWLLTERRGFFDTVIATRFVNVSGSAFMRDGYERMTSRSPEAHLVPEVARHIPESYDRSVYPFSSYLIPTSDDGPTQVFLAGVDTDACVMATALSLYTPQFAPVVIEDACGSSGGTQAHLAAITMLHRNLGPHGVVSAADLATASCSSDPSTSALSMDAASASRA